MDKQADEVAYKFTSNLPSEITQAGVDCEFVEKPPKSTQSECPICLLVVREPYQVSCCGYAYCKACIERIQKDSRPCPCCKREKFDMFEDKRLKRSLYEYKVRCSNSQQGCQWVGELGQLDNHLNLNPSRCNQLQGCQISQIKCLHCSQLFLRSDIKAHQNDQCPRRPFSCQYCKGFDSCYKVVATNHWPVCGSYPMPCTNKCGQTLQRQNLDNHITNDCSLTIIDCDFQHVGCKVRLPRKDMPAHQGESVVNHMSLQATSFKQTAARMEKEKKGMQENISLLQGHVTSLKESNEKAHQEILELKEKNRQLVKQVSQLTLDIDHYIARIPICPCEFTIDNFEQRKEAKEDWMSPPFYSHARGYKMCLEACTNYWVVFKGATYVAVFIHLMKGDFDYDQSWPFSGKVYVTLVSHDDSPDHNHTIDFTDNDASRARRRVTNRDKSEHKHGRYDFISHERLLPSYMTNDSLTFRITTENT